MEERFPEPGLGRTHSHLQKIHIPSRWTSFTDSKNNTSFGSDGPFNENFESKKSKSNHRSHLHRHRHRHNSPRETIQSAVQLPTQFSFDSYNPLKRSHHNQHHVKDKDKDKEKDKDSSSSSQEASRRNSSHGHFGHHGHHSHQNDGTTTNTTVTANGSSEGSGNTNSLKHPEVQEAEKPLRRIIRPNDIVVERKRRERRTEETADALNALSRDAYTATRKLDDTYYALLERLAILRSTITSLRELSGQAARARTNWEKEVHKSSAQVSAKIDSFKGFSAQEEVVESLVLRLRQTKDRSGELEHRLEGCRGRLEEFQRKEQESRLKVDKRWRMCWFSLAALGLFVLALVVWKHQSSEMDLVDDFRESGESLRDGMAELAAEVGVVDRQKLNKTKPGIRIMDAELERQSSVEDEKWKRVLDEL